MPAAIVSSASSGRRAKTNRSVAPTSQAKIAATSASASPDW